MATMEPLVRNVPQQEALRKRQSWRRMKNRIALCLSLLTMAFGLFWLCWILIATVGRYVFRNNAAVEYRRQRAGE